MLLSTLWMLVQDFNREFKAVQREFREVETALTEWCCSTSSINRPIKFPKSRKCKRLWWTLAAS